MRKFISFLRIRRKIAQRTLPKISLSNVKHEYRGTNFAAPNPDITAAIKDIEGNVVGRTVYTVSPLKDRIYLFDIKIDPSYRRQGLGLALLVFLAKKYDLPLTVVQPISPALLFWENARKEVAHMAHMTESLSMGDMDAEKARWNHLQPQVQKLERLIAERFRRGETYSQAVSRGLDE
jgi:hypothetical protein